MVDEKYIIAALQRLKLKYTFYISKTLNGVHYKILTFERKIT